MPASQELYYPDQAVPDPDPCVYVQLSPQLDPDSAAWRGGDPAHGRLWQTWCPDAFYLEWRAPDDPGRQGWTYMGTFYVPDGVPPGQGPDIDPMVLVARAMGSLTIPVPEPHFGPDPAQVAVKVPVWLWVDYAGPIVVTTTAGGLSATVTATLDSTTWQMGEPYDVREPAISAEPVTCDGAGAPFAAGLDEWAPPCGYTYIWRSLPERTGGAATWTVTATAHWTVSWAVSTGVRGSQDVEATGSAPVLVREWRAVLVDKPGR